MRATHPFHRKHKRARRVHLRRLRLERRCLLETIERELSVKIATVAARMKAEGLP